RLADLAVLGRNRRGINDHAAFTVRKRLKIDHPERAVRYATKAADQIDSDRELELLHRVTLGGLGLLVASDRLCSIGDTGAVHEHALLAVGISRLRERRSDLLVAGYIDL